MSLNKAQNLVDEFNNGNFEDDIEPFFNDILTFLKFVKKYGLLDEIDLNEIRYNDWNDRLRDFLEENGVLDKMNYHNAPNELKNYLLLHKLNENYENAVLFITEDLLSDVHIRPDGFYLQLRSRDELAQYFCSGGRNYQPQDIAEQIFSEEGLNYNFYDSGAKPYETVSELNDENLTRLKDIIYKEIGNTELSLEDYHSDFFEHLSEIQETSGYFRIRPEDLNDLLKDADATNEIFDNDLEEIGSELRNLYFRAENTAYEDEVYQTFYDALDEYFEGNIDEVATKKNDKTVYVSYIKIRDFISNVREFLNDNIGGNYSSSFLEYYGNYTDFIINPENSHLFECIDVRVPEYPDWTRAKKIINSMFNDYI
jgi:hypothetical protein